MLGIIGEDPFQDDFASLKGKRVKGRNIDIRYFKGFSNINSQDKKTTLHPNIEDIKECDLLFVCSSERQYISNILDPIRNQTILTIADMPDFLENGGIINFIVEKHKVKFEVNTDAAKRAKLIIRSRLIKLAKRVVEKDDVEKK